MRSLPIARQPDHTNTRMFMGNQVSYLIDGNDTQGQDAMMEMNERKGMEPPPHIHHREDETFYVLEGEVTYYSEGKSIHATPGMCVFLPRGVAHSFLLNTEKAKVLTIVTPAGFEDFTKELSSPLPDQLPPSEEAVQKLISVATKYGIEILIPSK